MSNDYRAGLHITPLTLWVAGIVCALISFIGITGLVKLDKVQDNVTTLVTSQKYDRSELDALKGDVKSVQGEVRSLADRVGKLEPRK